MNNEKNLIYDFQTLYTRLGDLRSNKNKQKYTLQKLSKELEEKTGVYISHTQLSKYENTDIIEDIGLNNFIALAKFYNVPFEYLLEEKASKRKNTNYKLAAAKFGLSDSAMDNLLRLQQHTDDNLKINLINFMLENPIFLFKVLDSIINYLLSKDSHSNNNTTKKIEYEIITYFIEVINEYYETKFKRPEKPFLLDTKPQKYTKRL